MPAMRRSRRVAGLSPSTTTPPASAPALIEEPTAKKHSFRRTAARAATTPKRVVGTTKRAVEAVLEDNQGPAKRSRTSSYKTSISSKTSSTDRDTSPARSGADTPNQQIAKEASANSTTRPSDTKAPFSNKAATPVVTTTYAQGNGTESIPTQEDEQPAPTPSRFSSFISKIFRAGGTPKQATPTRQDKPAATTPRYAFDHFTYTPGRIGTTTAGRAHSRRTSAAGTANRPQSDARPEPAQIATVATSSPPGTTLPAFTSASPPHFSLSANQQTEVNSVSSLLRIVDALPKDLHTDLYKVFEAIASWKSQNRDSPLPSVSGVQKFLDDSAPSSSPINKDTTNSPVPSQPAPKAAMEPESFSSTFRAPSPSDPYTSDEDSATEDEVPTKTIPAIVESVEKPSVAIPPTPKVFSNTFRAPSPNNPDDWSSDSEMSDDEPEKTEDTNLMNTPCPKAGAKKFSRSRSTSLTNGNTTLQGQSIFDKTSAHATATNTTIFDTPKPTVEDEDVHTPESASPHVTPFVRTPAPRSPYKGKNAHTEAPMAKSLMHSNFIGYIEGEGINIKLSINQELVNDFNNRAPMVDVNWVKLDGLETAIYELASMGGFDEELKEFELRRMREKAGREEERGMDVDTILEDEDVDMDASFEDKDASDFDIERLKDSSMAQIIDSIPDEEFEEL